MVTEFRALKGHSRQRENNGESLSLSLSLALSRPLSYPRVRSVLHPSKGNHPESILRLETLRPGIKSHRRQVRGLRSSDVTPFARRCATCIFNARFYQLDRIWNAVLYQKAFEEQCSFLFLSFVCLGHPKLLFRQIAIKISSIYLLYVLFNCKSDRTVRTSQVQSDFPSRK